ncbi:MAG: hypothetical protein AAF492_22085 [Verrucomicrobiota bacterium]
MILLLGIALADRENHLLGGALILLITAFIIGLALLTMHVLKKKRPAWLIGIHILFALSGFALLAAGVLRY